MSDLSQRNTPNSDTPQPSPASQQKIADRYILKEIIGEGSYSIVFRGYDTDNQRKVAVKELKSRGLTKEEANEAQQLFFNEINILKQLSHPNIPEVYDFFLFEGRHYMVMQWVEGENLLSVLEREGPIGEVRAIDYMGQIVDALVYLQDRDRRIVYKDIKPSNIIVNDEGLVRLIDFGTARFYSPDKMEDTHVLGTPGYAPPEAYTGAQTDFSADIYSLGATFYHLVTGQEPFKFKFNFPSPQEFEKGLSRRFGKLLMDCLKPKGKRIGDAVELKRRIERLKRKTLFGGKNGEAGIISDDSVLRANAIFIATLLFSWFYFSYHASGGDDACCGAAIFPVVITIMGLSHVYILYVRSKGKIYDHHYLPLQISFVILMLLLTPQKN